MNEITLGAELEVARLRIAELEAGAKRASAELRHAFKAKDYDAVDWFLIERAIRILEETVGGDR